MCMYGRYQAQARAGRALCARYYSVHKRQEKEKRKKTKEKRRIGSDTTGLIMALEIAYLARVRY